MTEIKDDWADCNYFSRGCDMVCKGCVKFSKGKQERDEKDDPDWQYKSILKGKFIHEGRDPETEKIKEDYNENDETNQKGEPDYYFEQNNAS